MGYVSSRSNLFCKFIGSNIAQGCQAIFRITLALLALFQGLPVLEHVINISEPLMKTSGPNAMMQMSNFGCYFANSDSRLCVRVISTAATKFGVVNISI